MNKNHLLQLLTISVFLFNFVVEARATNLRQLTLENVIAIAREQSPDALEARHRYRGSYWQFQTYRAGFLPHLRFDATLPHLNRVIAPITMPDGTDAFVRRSLATSTGTLSLSQTIGLTGGQLFVSSGLQRIDLFREDGSEVSYLATPVNLGFRQPILAFNPMRWGRKIEPLRFEEARKEYIESMEDISVLATGLFFDLLLAQINVEISKQNLAANDTLFRISQGRFALGRIAESDLLQMELNVLNSTSTLEQSRIDHEGALFRFRSYLALDASIVPELIAPEIIPALHIKIEAALAEARKNRSDLIAYRRQLLEAEMQVSRARAEGRINANLFAVYGLTQTAAELNAVYRNPLDQQQLTIGISVPILDWGVARGRLRMAQSNRDLVTTTLDQALVDFEQEVLLRVMEFNMLGSQLEIARRADAIAQKRYDVTLERFLIGRIDLIDLNLAIQERDRAKQRYLAALRTYWLGFYEIRRLTLFDFINNEPLQADFEGL